MGLSEQDSVPAAEWPSVGPHRPWAFLVAATDVQRDERLRLERAINWARWGGAAIVFAVGPVFPNIGLPYVVGLGLFLLVYGTVVRKLQDRVGGGAYAALSAATFAADILVVSAAMLVFSPDPLWTTYVYGALIVITGAFRFGRKGAFGGAVMLGVAYAAIALYREPAFGHQFDVARVASNVGFLVLTAMLMTAILRELHALRELSARRTEFYESLLRAQSDLGEVIIVNEGTRPVYWNDALMDLSGRERAELASVRSIYDLLAAGEREPVRKRLQARLRDGRGDIFETTLLRPDGTLVPLEMAVHRFRRAEHDWTVVVARDITERKAVEGKLQHQALHDPLTGLSNRTLLNDRLELAIAASRRGGGTVALLLMDLDDFKRVNDALGHQAGDALLSQLSKRMRSLRRETDTVARLGGDEFAVVLPGVDAYAAETIARQMLTALERPFVVEGQELEIGASVGISVFPGSAQGAGDLLRQADVAMYVAKRERSGCTVYEPAHDGAGGRQMALTAELRAALERHEFVPFYQPLVQIGGSAIAMEALVRWIHPTRGVVGPAEFVHLTEQSGLIRPLFRSVLRDAADACRSWRDAGWELTVAVNLSVRNVQDPNVVGVVAEVLAESALEPSALILELTESAVIPEPTRSRLTLERLRALGVRLSLDDFGTGYSSLSHVHRMPVQQLKIDRSFVRSLTIDGRSAALVRSTIELGHNFGLEVVAEGVEDGRTLAALGELGCDTAQGYHFARPMPADEVLGWLEAQPRSIASLEPASARAIAISGQRPA